MYKQKQINYTKSSAGFNDNDIQFVGKNGGILCYEDSYIQIMQGLIGSETLYLDFETTSCDSTKDSLNPWKHCWITGIAVCSGDYGPAYYISVEKDNEEKVYQILYDIFSHQNLKRWINHNIKYDAHVLANSAGIIPNGVELIDTLTLAKLIDSDRFRYGLDILSKEWLNEDISEYEAALTPYKHKNKDYGQIPLDIIAPYACQDVLTNRKLYKYICDKLPESCKYVRDTEIKLTLVLFEIEQNGLQVIPEELDYIEALNYIKLLKIEEELEQVTGKSFRPHTNADCLDILCNYYGLPVLAWTQEDEETGEKTAGSPSFDKYALAAYAAHPLVNSNEKIKTVVEKIIEYRNTNTFNNLFVKKFKEQHINGILHPFYNQCVRTGRLSCKEPNAQQMSKSAKSLVHPYGTQNCLLSYDFSQIEFRTIAHYSESPKLVAAYNENPDTDFHTWTAEICGGISRQSAKTMNFLLGFGGGKKKTLKALSSNMDLIGNILEEVKILNIPEDKREDAFNRLAEQRAEEVYNKYHREMPEIKQVSKRAESVCKSRGHVFNMFGRQRHLNYNRAHTAFNFLNQSTAADIFKERIVFIADLLQGSPIKIVANVHDELLFDIPSEILQDKRIVDTLGNLLEHPNFPEGREFKVPIRVSCGYSKLCSQKDTWREASESASLLKYENVVEIEEFKSLIGV